MEKRILFTVAGSSDPAMGKHDGAILHILRHFKPNKAYMLLTNKMQKAEKNDNRFSAIEKYLKKKCGIECKLEIEDIKVEDADDYEALTKIQDKFNELFNKPENKDAKWLINISSGTPQIQTVMSLLALNHYSHSKKVPVENNPVIAIQVRDHNPDKPLPSKQLVQDSLSNNIDNERNAENRCRIPQLQPFNEYRLKNQIISLINKYEYRGAHDLVDDSGLFSDTIIKPLLEYARLRKDLQSEEANKTLDEIHIDDKVKEKLRIGTTGEARFFEFFQVMELCQRNEQLSEFVLKLSPVLMDIGIYYLKEDLRKKINFQLEDISWEKSDSQYKLLTDNILFEPQYLKLSSVFNIYDSKGNCYGSSIRRKHNLRNNDDLTFYLIVRICKCYKDFDLNGDDKHKNICDAFDNLRKVEDKVRNPLAHTMTNVTHKKLEEGKLFVVEADSSNPDLKKLIIDSVQILNLLHYVIKEIRGNDIEFIYDELNALIIDSLQ